MRAAGARVRGGEHGQAPADDRADVLAHQRGRHQAEERQRRIAAADVGRVDEDVAELLGARAAGELGAFVGDRDEVIGPARLRRRPRAAAESARPASSARSSCPTCSRGDTASRRGVSRPRGPPPDRSSRACGARPARRDAEDRAQHFGREARSAHAEQHDVGEAVALDAVGERRERDRASRPSAAATRASRAGWRSSSARSGRRPRPTDRAARVRPPRARPPRRATDQRIGERAGRQLQGLS